MGFLSLPAWAQLPAAGLGTPGILSGFQNPAFLDTDGKKWCLNLMAVSASATSNTASIHFRDFGKSGADFLRTDIMGTSSISSGVGSLDLKTPSFAIRASDRLTVALNTRTRIHANYADVDGRLLSEIGEITKVEQSYPYRLPQIANMRTSIAAFSEVGLSLSYELVQKAQHRIRIGGNLKLINGIAHTAIDVSDLAGTIRLNSDQVSFITAATGTVSTLSAGELFNKFSIVNLFQADKLSMGGDIGLSYSYQPSVDEPWKFRFGVSVTDIGSIRYKADSAYSKSYDIDIATDKRLYFNGSFNNALFSRASRVFEKYPQYFTPTNRSNKVYSVALPTMLHIQADYRLSQTWVINAGTGFNLRQKDSSHELHQLPYIAIVPAWVKNGTVLSLPFAYQKYAGLTSGLALRHKGFTIGSNSILSAIFGGKQIDLRLGYLISSSK